MCWRRCWSKSSPPRKVSPLVDFTSKTPFCISRTEISNVPPPRSYTAILEADASHTTKPEQQAISAFPMHTRSAVNGLCLHFILGFLQAVGQSSGCGLVDDTQDVQTGDLTGVFGSLKKTHIWECCCCSANVLSTLLEKEYGTEQE